MKLSDNLASGVRISSLQNNRGRGRRDTLEGFFQQSSQLSHHHKATPTNSKLDTVCRDVASKVITMLILPMLAFSFIVMFFGHHDFARNCLLLRITATVCGKLS